MSVSLVAVAAVAASLFFARHRQPEAITEPADADADRATVSLEELRRAGF